MARLVSIDLQGFRSIRALTGFSFNDITLLIGANGAGKSNFISFFRMLSWMMSGSGELQQYVAKCGGANSVLFEGAQVTPTLSAKLKFTTEQGTNDYQFRLAHAGGDILIFLNEEFRFSRKDFLTQAPWHPAGAGHREAQLLTLANEQDQQARTARTIAALLKRCVVYQFHNTSLTARIRQRWDRQDNLYLKEDGANLAPVLQRLQQSEPAIYRKIIETLKLILPFFADFVFDERIPTLLLQWREQASDLVFGAHQASDGMLRIMALVTLLLHPPDRLPDVLMFDEPELGLHPYAITLIAEMFQALALHRQVILATQSPTFINYFAPEDIVVVDRPKRESVFTRLKEDALREWLKEYSLSDLWEKNVFGGRPT